MFQCLLCKKVYLWSLYHKCRAVQFFFVISWARFGDLLVWRNFFHQNWQIHCYKPVHIFLYYPFNVYTPLSDIASFISHIDNLCLIFILFISVNGVLSHLLISKKQTPVFSFTDLFYCFCFFFHWYFFLFSYFYLIWVKFLFL